MQDKISIVRSAHTTLQAAGKGRSNIDMKTAREQVNRMDARALGPLPGS
jgi:hypothetical protein